MNKKLKHRHNVPFHKVKSIETLLKNSDIGKMKWHRIFGWSIILRPYNDENKTIINSNHKHIQIFNEVEKKWIDIFGSGELGNISNQVVCADDLFDSVQDDDIQRNLAPRIRIIS